MSRNPPRSFIDEILNTFCQEKKIKLNSAQLYRKSPLIQYLDLKMGAVDGNSKTRRSLASIYAIYSIVNFYLENEYFEDKSEYKKNIGFEFSILHKFYRSLYGGDKLQNHALNSRVNFEFQNKIFSKSKDNPDLISINKGKYLINIVYLYIGDVDISKLVVDIIQKYIELLKEKDHELFAILEDLKQKSSIQEQQNILKQLLSEKSEARIFEILSYAILKNYYQNSKIYIGYSREEITEEYLHLYKTGRTNANDGGIDFVMKPLGRFFQVTEVNSYDKYLLDMDKVLHFPITFVVKTTDTKEKIEEDLSTYIEKKSGGMKVIKDRYLEAIEEIITINELNQWLEVLSQEDIQQLLIDLDLYYRLELNLL